jgi:S-DNA-T family DNA segregation ATPase FtsK/SpoIIIE
MIMSLLFNAKPDEVKLIMIDPKKVEFTVYKSIPHLLVPVVSDPRKAAGALSWAVAQMDKRYALFAENGVRNLQSYNAYAVSNGLPKMPQIVIIIDELSDLMMAASNEVEDSICRLAQKARAAGMHLIVATQRPSVDVITGLIKANIPSRIAFAVKSQIDSRTIIDTQGAEKLLGNGDMLYCPVGLSKPVRVQGCYVSDDEIERVIEFVTAQGDVKYDDAVMQEIEINAAQAGGKKKGGVELEVESASSDSGFDDDMTPKAIDVVIEAGMASTTLLQRKLKLGYARAARIVDELSEKGIIGPYEGSKPRKVLITKEQWLQMQANSDISVPKQLSIDDIAPSKPMEDTDDKTDIPDNHNYFGSATSNLDTAED